MDDLVRYRTEIDAIDDRIVDLLARRFVICRDVAHYKLRHGVPVVLPDRIEQVKNRCAARGAEQGLDPVFVAELYARIIDRTCEAEQAFQAEASRPDGS